MRILQFGKAYPPVNLGGVESTIQLICEGLVIENIYCDVLGVNNISRSVVEETKFGLVYRESLLFKAFSTLFSISLIYRLFEINKKYDLIHIHHPDPMSAFALWIVKPECKVVLHWHSDILRQKFLLKFFKPLQNWLLNRADKIIATTSNYAAESIHLNPFKNKLEIIPIGIDSSKLKIDHQRVQEILSQYKGQKLILAIGRMSYYKGYEYLVDSLEGLDENYRLLIIGSGRLLNKLQDRIPRKLKNKITFLGGVSDLERNCFLHACDILVLSSIYKTEAFAIVQVEAMALGKPVVSTEIPGSGVQWVNLNMISGLTIPIKNSVAISNAINTILGDSVLYKKLSAGALSRYNSEFTQEIMVKKIKNLYINLLDS